MSLTQVAWIITGIEVGTSLLFFGIVILLLRDHKMLLKHYERTDKKGREELKPRLVHKRSWVKFFSIIMFMPLAIYMRHFIPNPDNLLKLIPPVLMASLCIYAGKRVWESAKDLKTNNVSILDTLIFASSGFMLIMLILTINLLITNKDFHDELIKAIAKKLE